MSNKPVVLLDCDGVIGEFIGHTLTTLAALGCPSTLVPVQNTQPHWDFWQDWIPLDWKQPLLAHMRRPGWCLSIPVLPGAQEGVAALQEVADVYFVTSPMADAPYWHMERMQWLQTHFGDPDKQVIFCDTKHRVLGDVFVDDKPANVDQYAVHHAVPTDGRTRGAKVFLWEQSYNMELHKNGLLHPAVVRTGDWALVLDAARSMAG